MPKQINDIAVDNINYTLRLAKQLDDVNGQKQYIPALVSIHMDVLADDGSRSAYSKTSELGARSNTKPTAKQLYNQLNTAQAGPALAAALKTAVLDALNEDVSV